MTNKEYELMRLIEKYAKAILKNGGYHPTLENSTRTPEFEEACRMWGEVNRFVEDLFTPWYAKFWNWLIGKEKFP